MLSRRGEEGLGEVVVVQAGNTEKTLSCNRGNASNSGMSDTSGDYSRASAPPDPRPDGEWPQALHRCAGLQKTQPSLVCATDGARGARRQVDCGE